MTNTQQKLYDFIKTYVQLNGHGPTYGVMRNFMSVSSNQAITDLLSALERDGFITIIPGKKGGIGLGENSIEIVERDSFLKTTHDPIEAETNLKEGSGTSDFFVLLNPGFSNIGLEVPNIKSATTKGREKWNGTP